MADITTPLIIRCVIADDEPLARTGMQQLVRQVPFLQLEGVARDALEINQLLHVGTIDLLFLDIQMPHINGLDYLRTLKNPPKVIFTTAYPEYALEGYELDILDYLLKPVTLQRFLKAANKAKEYFEMTASLPDRQIPAPAHIFIKTNKLLQKVLLSDILFIEARLNYVIIQTIHDRLITYASLKHMEEQLPSVQFLKIHKSYIIAVNKISQITGNEVRIANHLLPVSRTHKENLLKAIRKT